MTTDSLSKLYKFHLPKQGCWLVETKTTTLAKKTSQFHNDLYIFLSTFSGNGFNCCGNRMFFLLCFPPGNQRVSFRAAKWQRLVKQNYSFQWIQLPILRYMKIKTWQITKLWTWIMKNLIKKSKTTPKFTETMVLIFLIVIFFTSTRRFFPVRERHKFEDSCGHTTDFLPR